jgi:hypothetical protein
LKEMLFSARFKEVQVCILRPHSFDSLVCVSGVPRKGKIDEKDENAHLKKIGTSKQKKNKSGTTPYPNGASASAPRAGRNGRGQHRATRDAGGSTRADRERRTSPEANTQEPAGITSSATEAPTKRTKAAITEHTASRREREQSCRKEKGFRSQGMQSARTESASKESTLSARRTRSRAADA